MIVGKQMIPTAEVPRLIKAIAAHVDVANSAEVTKYSGDLVDGVLSYLWSGFDFQRNKADVVQQCFCRLGDMIHEVNQVRVIYSSDADSTPVEVLTFEF